MKLTEVSLAEDSLDVMKFQAFRQGQPFIRFSPDRKYLYIFCHADRQGEIHNKENVMNYIKLFPDYYLSGTLEVVCCYPGMARIKNPELPIYLLSLQTLNLVLYDQKIEIHV